MPRIAPEGGWITGVYCILNLVNWKVYVGGAYKSFEQRKSLHFRDLRYNCHDNTHLQRAYNKYGAENFEFIILEQCPREECEERETFWIAKLQATDEEFGYNKSPRGGSNAGCTFTDEARENIRRAAAATSPELKAKRAAAVSKALKGCALTEEHREKIANSMKRAFEEDPGLRDKWSKAQLGRKKSEAMRQKMVEVLKARWADPEARAKMTEARRKRMKCNQVFIKVASPAPRRLTFRKQTLGGQP